MAKSTDGDPTKRDIQMNVMISQDEKSKWTNWFENSAEAKHMSDFIRMAANHEVKYDGYRSGGTGSGGVEPEAIEGIQDTLNRVERGISNLHDRMDTVEKELESDETPGSVDLQKSVYAALPEDSIGNRTPDEVGITTSEVATRVRSDEDIIRPILDELKRISTVRSGVRPARSDAGPVTYWWIEAGGEGY